MVIIFRRGRSGLVAALLLAVALPAQAQEDDISVLHPLGLVDKFLLDEAAAIHSGWMREQIVWRYYESADDVFTPGGYESDLLALEARGLRLSPVVVTGRCWATWKPGDTWDPESPDADTPSGPPADLSAVYDAGHGYSATYYDFIHHFVSSFGDRIDRITIENEVNASNFWDGTIDEYIRVLTTARKAAQDANPLVLVFDSGMGSGSWGAPVAQDRYEDGHWSWTEARDFLVEYYERDAYVPLPAIGTEGALQTFFASGLGGAVPENYARVVDVLTSLYSDELDMMLVDGLNLKFTGEPWLLDEVVTWIDEVVASVPEQTPLPVKVNNEASSWCVDPADVIPHGGRFICELTPSDFPLLATEMMRKVVQGIEVGVVQSLWFPFSNCLVDRDCDVPNEPTPRLGLYDYDGNPTEALTSYQILGRFIAGNRDFSGKVARGGGSPIHEYAFTERITKRTDVRVMWWDDGFHGSGSLTATVDAPSGTVAAKVFTQDGDSTSVPVVGDGVTVTVSREPLVLYFDDGYTPIDWPLDPVVGPAPPQVVLGVPAPNPAPGWTRVRFGLDEEVHDLSLRIHDVAGRRVATLLEGSMGAGVYSLVWDGRNDAGQDVAGGVYLVSIQTGGRRQVQKLLVVR